MGDSDVVVVRGSEVERLLLGRESDIVRAVRAAYELHGQGQSYLPQSVFLRFPDNDRNRIIALPSYLGGEYDLAGLKWVSSFPGNVNAGLSRASAIIVLNSSSTGRPEAILEGSWINAKRTAASAALVAQQILSGRKASTIGVIGCGPINLEVIRFLHAVGMGEQRVIALDVAPDRALAFSRKCSELIPDAAIHTSTELDQVLGNADVISIATTALKPHINDISACRAGTVILHVSLRDLAPNVILKSENIVDDIEHVCRAQTSVHLAEQQVGNRDFITQTVPDLILRGYGGDGTNGVVIVSPFGLGILDIAVASLTRDLAIDCGCAERIERFLPPEARLQASASAPFPLAVHNEAPIVAGIPSPGPDAIEREARSSLMYKGDRPCSYCRHCIPVWELDNYGAFCNNAATKLLDAPIGFLSREAKECLHFESVKISANLNSGLCF